MASPIVRSGAIRRLTTQAIGNPASSRRGAARKENSSSPIPVPRIPITGASLNFFEPWSEIVFRAEVGMFWDEPVFIPEENLALSDGYTQNDLFDMLVDSLGLELPWPGIPHFPLTGGTVPKRDILRWMIGFDKFLWIRPINKISMFMLSAQWFAQYTCDWNDRIRQPLPDAPKTIPDDPIEQLFG